jgi:hypothetical protein
MANISLFLSGGIMVGFLAIGFFFFRFWQKTHDTLFATFAVSFWILALERLVLLATSPTHELRPYVYLIRFTAFMLLIVAIWNKNRRRLPSDRE